MKRPLLKEPCRPECALNNLEPALERPAGIEAINKAGPQIAQLAAKYDDEVAREALRPLPHLTETEVTFIVGCAVSCPLVQAQSKLSSAQVST